MPSSAEQISLVARGVIFGEISDKAIVNYNVAQVQLLHDIGMTSIDNITSIQPINLTQKRKTS